MESRYDYDGKKYSWYQYQRVQNADLFELSEKIVVPYKADSNKFAIDYQKRICSADVYLIGLKDNSHLHIKYILAILNSSVIEFYFKLIAKKIDYRYEYYAEPLGLLPIICLPFISSAQDRAELLKTGKNLCSRYINMGDQTEVIDWVFLQLKHKLERFDVIHDLLAYLAEQMIEMNKQKNQEIKGFLAWLENYLGVKIDDLKNKTKIREYHEGTIELLLEVLDQNRKAITKINIQGREAREQIKTEFEKSMAKLKPLKDRIEATDKLIDQIVYKLYGLTDEEIKIVEESLSSQPKQTEDVGPEDD